MITISQMGFYGQLGNQLFQYATLLDISARRGQDIVLPDRFSGYSKKEGLIELGHFNITAERVNPELLKPANVYTEHPSEHTLEPQIWSQPDDTDFVGYFQNEKYFEAVENLVREELKLHEVYFEWAKEFIVNIPRPWTSIQVRRGDCLQNPHVFHVLPKEWYLKAAERDIIPRPCSYIVVSDDLPWCKENLTDLDGVFFCESPGHFYDLAVMALCDAHVISPSTFAWWGTWFSDSRKVVAPDPWFPKGGPYINLDIFRKGWDKLEVQ